MKKKKFRFFIIIIIFGWVFEEQAIEIYIKELGRLDFWMLELIIIAYLNSIIFHIEIYRHQKFVIYFNLIPIAFKIITIFLELNDYDQKRYAYEDSWYWFPIGLLIYFIIISIKSYAIIKIKWLMDLKYISADNLLIIYGIIGTVFYSVFSVLSLFIKSENDSLFINDSYSFYSYFCVFKKSDGIEIIIEL